MLAGLRKTLGFVLRHPVHQGRPLRAICRFAYWQIRLRLTSDLQRTSFINNVQIGVRKGLHGVTGVAYLGLPDFEEMGFFLHYLRAEDHFVDVGANVGAYSVLASAGADCQTVSVEPVVSAHQVLKANLKIAGTDNDVQLFNCALGEEDGECKMTVHEDATNHILSEAEENGSSVVVPIRRLDDLEFERMDVLKLDVEGFEYPVLRGGMERLKQANVIMIELNGSGLNYGYSDEQIRALLDEYGFKCCRYDPQSRELIEQPGYQTVTCNSLMVRDVDKARERVGSAPGFRVLGREY